MRLTCVILNICTSKFLGQLQMFVFRNNYSLKYHCDETITGYCVAGSLPVFDQDKLISYQLCPAITGLQLG